MLVWCTVSGGCLFQRGVLGPWTGFRAFGYEVWRGGRAFMGFLYTLGGLCLFLLYIVKSSL